MLTIIDRTLSRSDKVQESSIKAKPLLLTMLLDVKNALNEPPVPRSSDLEPPVGQISSQ